MDRRQKNFAYFLVWKIPNIIPLSLLSSSSPSSAELKCICDKIPLNTKQAGIEGEERTYYSVLAVKMVTCACYICLLTCTCFLLKHGIVCWEERSDESPMGDKKKKAPFIFTPPPKSLSKRRGKLPKFMPMALFIAQPSNS